MNLFSLGNFVTSYLLNFFTMQINPSSKMYKCIHATAINIKKKQTTQPQISYLLNINQSINPWARFIKGRTPRLRAAPV